MRKYLIIPVVTGLVILLHGCTWVQTTPLGEAVTVASADDVRGCQRKSKVTVSLKNRVAGVERKQTKVADELATLARNEGGRLGGDTVVAESAISEGSQDWGIYICK